MKTTATLVTCLAVIANGLPDGKPTGGSEESKSTTVEAFSVQQMRNKDFKAPNAVHEYYLAQAKYAKSISPSMKNAIIQNPLLGGKFAALGDENSSTASQVATPVQQYDSEYVIPVNIGNPPQTLPMNLDTGSADFWCFSTDTYPPDVQHQTLYNISASSTNRRAPGQSWKVKYGDNTGASGIVYRDDVSINGLTAKDHGVQVAIAVSAEISKDSASSGIMGMGYSISNTVRPTQEKTFMDNVMSKLAKPVFTADLKKGLPGTYDFGYINSSLHKGEIAYAPINRNLPYWEIQVSGYQFGNNGNYIAEKFPGIIDTGTSLILLPGDMVRSYYALVQGSYFDPDSAMTVFPCNATLPDFIFGIDSYRGVVPGHYINYAPADGTMCFGGIQLANGIPFAVLGDVLIKAQFVVFNRGDHTVGFANKKTVPPN